MSFGFGVTGGYKPVEMPEFDPLEFDPLNPVKIPEVLEKPIYQTRPVNKPFEYQPLQFGVARPTYQTTAQPTTTSANYRDSKPKQNNTMLMLIGGLGVLLLVAAVAA